MIALNPFRKNAHLGSSLIEGGTGTAPGESVEVQRAAPGGRMDFDVAPHLGIGGIGEAPLGHSDDGEVAVQPQHAPDHARVSPEPARPETIAEHNDSGAGLL